MFSILVEPIVHPNTAMRIHPIRNVEVLISEILGASITPKKRRVTNLDKT
jgi:predicted HAD superfamily phosphohydrolase YqeG